MSTALRIAQSLGGNRPSGDEYTARCPAHDDQNPSLSIRDTDNGAVLVHCHAGCEQDAVIEALKARCLWPNHQQPLTPSRLTNSQRRPRQASDDNIKIIAPVPGDAPSAFPPHGHGKPSANWVYRDEARKPVFLACRFDLPDGGKEVLPLVYANDGSGPCWHWKAFPSPRPLYNLPRLAGERSATVLIVEGEKTADAAQKLLPEFVVATSSGGCNAASRSNWTPLEGRDIVIWPDHDEPGAKYAADVAELAYGAGAQKVRVVTLPAHTPAHSDLADELWPLDVVQALLEAATDAPTIDDNASVDGIDDNWPEPDLRLLSNRRREPPALPLDTFGNWQDWIKETAHGASAPADFVAGSLLTAAAGLIGNARHVRVHERWSEPLILWAALIGNPSTGKSPAMDEALSILRSIEDDRAVGYDAQLLNWQTDVEAAKAAEIRWIKEVKDADDKKTPPPIKTNSAVPPDRPGRPQIVVSDTTREKLVEIVTSNSKGVLLSRDELTGWMADFDRYGGGGEREFWIEAYGGRPYRVDRVKNDSPLYVPHLSISVLGGMQPDKLVTALLRGQDDGLAARFLYLWPNPVPPASLEASARDPEAAAALRRLAQLTYATDGDGKAQPVNIGLSDDAKAAFQQFRFDLYQRAKDQTGKLASWIGKAPGFVLRIAGTLLLLDWSRGTDPEPDALPVEYLDLSIRLFHDYLSPMAESVFSDADIPDAERNAVALAKAIIRHKTTVINAREVRRNWNIPGLWSPKPMREAVEVLAEAGIVRPVKPVGGGRPRGDYDVNPALLRGI